MHSSMLSQVAQSCSRPCFCNEADLPDGLTVADTAVSGAVAHIVEARGSRSCFCRERPRAQIGPVGKQAGRHAGW